MGKVMILKKDIEYRNKLESEKQIQRSREIKERAVRKEHREKNMENITLEDIENEIAGWSIEDRLQLAGGFDIRGLDCVVQRWYGPKNYPNALQNNLEYVDNLEDEDETVNS